MTIEPNAASVRPGFSPIVIRGTAAVQPRTRVPSSEVDRLAGMPEGWTQANFAIRERAWASSDETASTLGAEAARQALDRAGWAADDLDVIIGACGVMEQPLPGTSALIQAKLGLGGSGIHAFDVNTTCLSFMGALDVAGMGVALGRWRKALIVSADIASAGLNFADPESSVIFGDGAAAVVLEAGDAGGETGLFGVRFETYSVGAELCQIRAGGTRMRVRDDVEAYKAGAMFQMDGPGVFRLSAKRFPRLVQRILRSGGVTLDDVDVVVSHQPSAAALDFLKRVLGPHAHKMVDIFPDHGNQIATSLPSAFNEAVVSGRLKRGGLALMVGTAAGVTLGGGLLRY